MLRNACHNNSQPVFYISFYFYWQSRMCEFYPSVIFVGPQLLSYCPSLNNTSSPFLVLQLHWRPVVYLDSAGDVLSILLRSSVCVCV